MERIISRGSVKMKQLIKSEPLIKRITLIDLIFGNRLVTQAFGSSGRNRFYPLLVVAVYLLAAQCAAEGPLQSGRDLELFPGRAAASHRHRVQRAAAPSVHMRRADRQWWLTRAPRRCHRLRPYQQF